MRLNPFNPDSIKVGDQRGMSFPGGGGGKLGCGSIVIAIIAALVFGVDPAQMLGGMQQMEGSRGGQVAATGKSNAEICSVNQYSQESCAALASLNETWEREFEAQGLGDRFRQPTLWFYSQAGSSGCGAAQSAMGPFYCPADQGIYIDTTFYDQMASEMGARGDVARLYVMAHEYGHHIQYITGIAGQIRSAQQQNPRAANQLQVRMELQADCYAGVWAAKNSNLLEAGDIEEGMAAASSVGDDTLMARAGRRVAKENFTHGSSAQRREALALGLRSGDDRQCDRYLNVR